MAESTLEREVLSLRKRVSELIEIQSASEKLKAEQIQTLEQRLWALERRFLTEEQRKHLEKEGQ
jgi:hypothetical protein